MPRSPGASLRTTLKITDEGSVFTFKPARGESLTVKSNLNRAQLAEQREQLREDLETFKQHIGSTLAINNWNDISEAIHCLHRRGRILAWQLFGKNCGKVQDLCRSACPGWEQQAVPPALVEVEASIEDIVPVEFLPLFDLTEPREINSLGTLASVVRRCIGFSTLVKRVLPRVPLARKTVLGNSPKLPVKFFHHAGLAGAQAEVRFFQANSKWVDLEGPWPDQDFTRDEVVCHVAKHLWDPTRRFNGCNRQPPDQVQHFACHCDTCADSSEDHFLVLAHDTSSHRKVIIGDLQASFADLSGGQKPQADTALPLVFLNACGSSAIDPAGVASFPRLFLVENGNRGFIGTETRIPDQYAAAFSEQFYTELLQGRPLGEAVHAARWTLLRRHNNPLGILYTVYADPDMRVRKPVTLKGATSP